MSYQVLARKWRPQSFHEMMGQEHVKQALINALNEQRLHHAYLFTGTRGVGKTTIARIFAKSLNCEEGISSTPCGQCSTCIEIESGKFIDLIEIDAASRTKVEDTREILDNVQYAPTRGRYKVYLIDEVHMLSKHSFNALLKTLEEPPEHVKFLLATTDPQKLPITILSRCLQFNLNAMAKGQIVEQLAKILPQENFQFEDDALNILAKAADGSMRDALSLTDQAIAQTNGNLTVTAVQQMLGLMDSSHAMLLMSAVLCQDGSAMMAEVENIALKNGNFVSVIDDLIALLHVIQLTQLVPQAAHVGQFDQQQVKTLAEQLSPQTAQLLYQLLLSGKKDLSWAPDAKLGFEMVMLRLLAFEGTDFSQASIAPVSTSSNHGEVKKSKAGALRDILNQNQKKTVQNAPESNAVAQGMPQPSQVQSQALPEQHASQQPPMPTPQAVPEQHAPQHPSMQTPQMAPEQHASQQLSMPTPQAVPEQHAPQHPSMQTPQMAPEQHSPQQPPMQIPQAVPEQYAPQQSEPANLSLPESESSQADSGPSEFDQQYNDIMAQATAQGFSESGSSAGFSNSGEMSSPVHAEIAPSASQLYSQKQGQAQSAIAKILQNRQISGAGKLLGGTEEPKKPDSNQSTLNSHRTAVSKTSMPIQTQAQPSSTTAEPQSTERTNTNVATTHRVPVPRAKKPEITERFKKDESKLAPELLEQLSPAPAKTDEPEHVIEIPIPENFTSPISSLKFAHEKDDWASLIEKMGLSGRVRQFALHAMFNKQGNTCVLKAEQSQQHLDSPMLRDKLQQSFTLALNEPVELHMEFVEQVKSTPFLIQQDIDQKRYLEAVDAVNSDPIIKTMVAEFDAVVNEKSVKAL
ncbi:DNA polymerase III subunit gamma/tau [Pseudoalteromonas luteoviolacea]|uniref:DNA polymerase III subunit gamma/tau n=1 Tax=Pseudoalteromonas luteoviolacea TaxID=43657 RepID=UPI001EEE2DF6|nr:DNA polymerase III subunit gamma/tau [Pseudoalteromonas luteoviolacea]MCF6442069.1 DNA polymerase III subunit gamma/tau [Pseudoalteromonas luteoviolacea]